MSAAMCELMLTIGIILPTHMTLEDQKGLEQLQYICERANDGRDRKVQFVATQILQHSAVLAIEFLLSIIKEQQTAIGITYGERNRLKVLEEKERSYTSKEQIMGTKRNDACLKKVGDDEPIFVLRAQDMLAPDLVRQWAVYAAFNDCPDEKVQEALDIADRMEAWSNRKMPD